MTGKTSKAEIKQSAQDRILGAIANELLMMAETYGFSKNAAEMAVFEEMRVQGARVAKFFGVYSFPGLIHEGAPLVWDTLAPKPSEKE